MNQRASPAGDFVVRTAGPVVLRCRPGTEAARHLDELAPRARRIAGFIDKRLKPLVGPSQRFGNVTFDLDPAGGGDSASSGQFAERLALALVHDRFGGPEVWTPPTDVPDAVTIAHVLEFVAFGLARHLASQAQQRNRGLFFSDDSGAVPRKSADQVSREVAIDRDGKVPLYECMIRGVDLIGSPPEYAALAESFCGYIFEREGPKAYRRFVLGSRENPNGAADLVYGKTLEELQQEWLGSIVRGYGRRPVSLKAFAVQILPYLRPYAWFLILALLLIFLSAGIAQIAPFVNRDIVDILTPVANKGDLQAIPEFFELLVQGITGGQPDFSAFREKHAVALDAAGRLYTKLTVLALSNFVGLATLVWLVYIVNVIGQNVLRDLRLRLVDRLQHLSAGFYVGRRMGDMITRFTSDIPRMAEPLVDTTAYSIYWAILLVATIVSMVVMSWQLSLLLFVIVPIFFIAAKKFGRAIQVASRTRQERLSQLNANLEEMLFGHTLVKSYGLGSHLMRRFRPKILEFRKVAIWTDFLRSLYKEIIGTIENVQTKLLFAVGGTLVVFGTMTLGTLFGFSTLMGRFLRPMHALTSIYAAVAVAAASLRRVEEVLREPMESMDTPAGGIFAPEGVHGGITFEHVGFSYNGVDPTLTDITLTIPAASSVAFVGPTGAGKSTLVSLIPRFYDVAEGAIKIDGRDIRSFSLAGLRQSISIVSQDTFLFNTTIMENIRLGRLDATDDEVIEAAKGARLHTFIESLPAGYDTLVGERGWRLSGGQKQRIAIARALLRNSPILILDEATSSLDAETESEILAELDEVTRGKTVISITHRLGLAIKSQKIFVLQAGQIVQEGSHEELIRQPGLYRKLFEDQNRELMERGAVEPIDLTQAVRTAPTLSMVRSPQTSDLTHPLKSEHYLAGAVLCEPNGSAARFYLLRSGQVELTIHHQDGADQHLQVGAPSGENGAGGLSLLLNIPNTVSASALSDVEVQAVHNDDLRALLGSAWQQRKGRDGTATDPAPKPAGLVPSGQSTDG